MGAQLNHTIVWCHEKKASATFLRDILDLAPPVAFGPFVVAELSNGVSLDFYEIEGEIKIQHYAFLISEDEFDQVFERIRARGLEYWADPHKSRPRSINRNDGGRGMYFEDPDGHFLEGHNPAVWQRRVTAF